MLKESYIIKAIYKNEKSVLFDLSFYPATYISKKRYI